MRNITSQQLLSQESKLRFEDFSGDDAWQIAQLLIHSARLKQQPILIHFQVGTRVIFHWESPGTTPDNVRWMKMKKRVTELYEHSSCYIGAVIEELGQTPEKWGQLDSSHFSASGGSFPILLKQGTCIGSINVSGYSNPMDDHMAIVSALREYFTKSQVTERQEK